MAKRGRPRVSPDEKAVSITIPQWAADMLDAEISDPIRISSLVDVDDYTDGNILKWKTNLPGNLHKIRREVIANMIQEKFSLQARYQDKIKIHAPCAGDADHFQEAADWMGEQQKRLEAEAPIGIRQAIEMNRGFLTEAGKHAIRKFENEQKEDDKT